MVEEHAASPPQYGDPLPLLVSVIIRSMGRLSLRQAMDSVTGQDYPHLELVVVNAKGEDHPSLPDHYGRIPLRLCDAGQPLPRSRAANLGMEQARGEYLLFLDDDDWLLPEHIGALVAALQQQPHLRVAYAGVECIREEPDGRSNTVLVYNQPFDDIRLLYENYIPIHAVLFERQLFVEGCRFDETLNVYEDWDFWLQLRTVGPFGYVDQVSAIYRLNLADNLGGTAQQGLLLHTWEAIIHKWRHHWSDAELRAICTQAKSKQQYRAERDALSAALEREKQATLTERQAWEYLSARLEQEQARHKEIVSVLEQRIETLAERIARQQHELETATLRLAAIESSTIWRTSYPYRWLMIRLRARWQQFMALSSATLSTPSPNIPGVPNPQPIDVIIPVYRGLEETRACLDSVLATIPAEQGEIIAINDASPEPELVAWLDDLAARHSRLTLLHNPENWGFVQTCNHGIALHPDRDVVLLNSDTVVANDWLARLQACAYRDRRIGTVTPFSNNATICSYPRFCADNPLPRTGSVADLDALFSRCNRGELTDIPTAVGFCMYIRRDCLNEVGAFDERHFGKGYGEENDFSMRAKALGWRNVLSADVFVYHAGSVSFADHQNHKKRHALAILNRLHPDYERLVHRHIIEDPARPFRLRVDLARLTQSRLPIVLFVIHERGGGTKKHVEELARLFSSTAHFLLLHPGSNDQHLLSWLHPDEALQLIFNLPGDADALQECLQSLEVRRIHFHHTLGLHPMVLELPARLGIPYDFTLHDYYPCCPQITLTDHHNHYCGEPAVVGCNRCLAIRPVRDGGDIQTWRQRYQPLITQAARVLAPSRDSAQRLARYFPTANILWAPHPDLDDRPCPPPQPLQLPPDAPLRIVVLGALSPTKGADMLEQCALDACLRGLPLAFELIGYAYRALRCPPRGFLQVHGPYDDTELPALLAAARPHLVWFPALWPETYSYTLSACLHLGLSVVVPDLGAFPERVAGRPWSWICPWQQSARVWNDFFIQIREQCFIPGCPPPLLDSRATPPSFEYRRDYWIANEATTPVVEKEKAESVMAATAVTFAYSRLTSTAQHRAALKIEALELARRLRRAPVLREITRIVPLRWQSHLRAWLRGTLS